MSSQPKNIRQPSTSPSTSSHLSYLVTQQAKRDHVIVVAASNDRSLRAAQLTTSSGQPSLLTTLTCCYGWTACAVNQSRADAPTPDQVVLIPKLQAWPSPSPASFSGDGMENIGGSGEHAGGGGGRAPKATPRSDSSTFYPLGVCRSIIVEKAMKYNIHSDKI